MNDLGIGIIGCGNISAAYFKLAPLFKGLDMRACADLNMDNARARAAEFGVRAQSVDALLAADDIDVVINLTIPAAHVPVSRAALEAGKHVYSEKPLALTIEEGLSLRDLAAEKGLRVGCAPDTFLGGAHQQARAEIDKDIVGRIVSGSAHVLGIGMMSWHPNPDFFLAPGGGPILDMGPYYIANLINLIGPVKRVGALTSSAWAEREIKNGPRDGEMIKVETPTNIHALLEFEQGATITLTASWDVHAHRHSNMELYGTEAALFVPDPNFFGGTVEIGVSGHGISSVPAWDHPFGVPNQEERANYRTAGLADMARAIREGDDARCSLERTLHGVDVMTAILRSGETGTFQDMQTTCTRPAALGPDAARALLRD